MPARFAGVFNASGTLRADRADSWREAGYPAAPPWRRTRFLYTQLDLAVDLCGSASLPDVVADEGGQGVAGTIRLDEREHLVAALGGAAWQTAGDAALVLGAYRRWGEAAFSRLEGDFAFVVWDFSAQTIHLVRDPFGVRRLHYATVGEAIIFSSDVEGVLAHPEVARRPDEITIGGYLLGDFSTPDRSFFQSVRRVRPRQFLRLAGGEVRLSPTRGPSPGMATLSSLDDYAELFRVALARSVAERVPRTGALVCQLSGGLDSMSVAALAASRCAASDERNRVILASARFVGLPCDEGGPVHEMGRYLRLPIREWNGLEPETSDLTNCRLAWPFGRSAIGGSHQGDVHAAHAVGADVLLSGFGGNQIAFEDGFLKDALRTGGWVAYGWGLGAMARNRPWRWGRRHLRRTLFVARRTAREALVADARRSVSRPSHLPRWVRGGLTRAWATSTEESTPAGRTGPVSGSWTSDAVWGALVEDATSVWAMEQMDARASEAGVEFRHPYLCWQLMTVAMSVPWRFRVPTLVDRPLQRAGLKGVLPDTLRLRDTYADFGSAFAANGRAMAREIEDILTRGPWRSDQFTNRQEILSEFRRLESSPGDSPADAWRAVRDVAALEAWLRRI